MCYHYYILIIIYLEIVAVERELTCAGRQTRPRFLYSVRLAL